MSKLAAAGLSRTVAGSGAAGVAASAERLAGEGVGAPHGVLEVGRARSVGARPAARNARLEVRPALADEDGRGRPLGDDRRQGRQVDALVAAAGDQHDRRVERAQRGDDRVGLGALRVVDEADAVDDGDRLEAVLDAARTPPPPRRIAVRLDAEQQPDRDRGQRVGDVVGARDRRARRPA